MADKDNQQLADTEAPDAAEFIELARQAVAKHDPPPEEYKQFSRLSFEFRGIPTAVEVDSVGEFAGARASTDSATQLVQHEGSELQWNVEGSNLVGVVSPDRAVRISLEASSGEVDTTVSDLDGVFAFALKTSGAHRLVVRDDAPWASPWFTP